MNGNALDSSTDSGNTSRPLEISPILISLLKGVVYQDSDSVKWNQLLKLQSRVREYVAVLGLELILDEAEGYAFLRSSTDRNTERDDDSTNSEQTIPRLVVRRPLSFPVSLLLALLRKKLAEFDTSGGDTRLVMTRDDIIELIRVFLPDSSNEAKLIDQVDRHINKVLELPCTPTQTNSEKRTFLKSGHCLWCPRQRPVK